jgi:cell division protein FtsB
MNCIKCGRKIADDAVFCSHCSAPPAAYTSNLQLPPQPPMNTPVLSKKEKKTRNYRRLTHRLTTATVVLSLLLAAALTLLGMKLGKFALWETNLRSREATLKIHATENEQLRKQITELESEIARLQSQIPSTPTIPLP